MISWTFRSECQNAITLRRCSPGEGGWLGSALSGATTYRCACWPCVYPSVKFISRKPPTCSGSPSPSSSHRSWTGKLPSAFVLPTTALLVVLFSVTPKPSPERASSRALLAACPSILIAQTWSFVRNLFFFTEICNFIFVYNVHLFKYLRFMQITFLRHLIYRIAIFSYQSLKNFKFLFFVVSFLSREADGNDELYSLAKRLCYKNC